MRQPSPVGTRVDHARKKGWHDRFLHYRHPPSEGAIDAWVRQFKKKHKDVVARLLDSVEVVTRVQMELAFKTLMNNVPGWNRSKDKRLGQWRFVPYSFSSGESGDQMIACFRQAMSMKERYYNKMFVHPHQLPNERLSGEDSVVLVDDFAGSGNQASNSWNRLFKELVGGAGAVYLLVVAATVAAQQEIRANTNLQLLNHFNLSSADNFFSKDCPHFSENERNAISEYCIEHFPDEPFGYQGCGLLFVLQHDCPNNSIPLLHKHRRNKWVPLFPKTGVPT
jgi:hypothetical protein